MRDMATGRSEQSQFLAAWGAEMVRVHLHHIEKVELDTGSLRDAILSARPAAFPRRRSNSSPRCARPPIRWRRRKTGGRLCGCRLRFLQAHWVVSS